MNPLDRSKELSRKAGLAGAVATVLCILGAVLDTQELLRSYLIAYLFWISIPLGAFAILMLHHMVGGRWGVVVRRILEAAIRSFPLMALLFLPIAFGLKELYPWARAGASADVHLAHKEPYLNAGFFLGRTAFYFAVWILVSFLLSRWSRQQDEGREGGVILRRLQLLSGGGLLLFGLTTTFSSVDWVMSLERQWYSTIYGAIFITGHGVAGLTFAILVLVMLRNREPFSRVVDPDRFHDLGKLLLAFVMLWAYMAFSQYLIMWSGNLPEEIPWYVHRTSGGWQYVGMLVIAVHFALPMMLLLSQRTKRDPRTLGKIAGAVLAMRLVDMYWITGPSFSPERLRGHVFDLLTIVAIGGLFVFVFGRELGRMPLLPVHDPRFERMLETGGAAQHG